jgi:hypothetical protein
MSTPRYQLFLEAAAEQPDALDSLALNILAHSKRCWDSGIPWHALLYKLEKTKDETLSAEQLWEFDMLAQAGCFHATCPAAHTDTAWSGTDVLDSRAQPLDEHVQKQQAEFAWYCQGLRLRMNMVVYRREAARAMRVLLDAMSAVCA